MKTIGHTNRILLRETTSQDAQDIYELNSDPKVLLYTGDFPFQTVVEAANFLDQYDHFKKYNRGRWAIINTHTKELLGWCGLKYHPDTAENDLGYRLFRKYWNKGYATEASHLALQYGFRRLGLESVIARAIKKNTASIKVIQKLGFEYEKDFEENGEICQQHRINKYPYMIGLNKVLDINI